MKCARCFKEIKEFDDVVSDPCCGAPDCEHLSDVSHYACLPYQLQLIEDADRNYDGYDEYYDYEEYSDAY